MTVRRTPKPTKPLPMGAQFAIWWLAKAEHDPLCAQLAAQGALRNEQGATRALAAAVPVTSVTDVPSEERA